MFRYLVIIIALFFLQACASTTEQKNEQAHKRELDHSKTEELSKFVGILKGGEYTNSSVPVKLSLPKSWSLQLADKSRIVVGGNDIERKIDPLVRNTYRLLYLLKYDEVPSGEFNASIIFILSDNSAFVKSSSPKAQNQAIKAGLIKSKKGYEFEESYGKELAGQEFNVLPTSVKLNAGVEVFQDYYTIALNGKMISFILTYTNEEHRQEIEAVMKTLQF